ncbi:MAG: anhydro-N-acetylmuramic acid kinase [Flavobacteriales bacterium]|nr:anhydro-N-acetylmuramic acid kinase [Flavobacteriales bacterium]
MPSSINKNKSYKIIGVMSGTSLDGLDIALCEFKNENKKWNYKIIDATTIPYSKYWKKKLADLYKKESEELLSTHSEYGFFIGKMVANFLYSRKKKADFIASHGHTIFHQPTRKFTLQIGHGACIYAAAKRPVICDFRSQDIALGGQGAPLVPIGDELLFRNYKYCLNIGGIANISFKKNGKRIAYDICAANMILNHVINSLGKEFDKDGKEGRKGKIIPSLLHSLNQLSYYQQKSPKSLAREDIEHSIFPLIKKYHKQTPHVLRTLYEHISIQISNHLKNGEVLVTGGGAKNIFLIELIKEKTNTQIIIPNHLLVDYKEALIFAFLGVLKFENKINILSSVTGSLKNHSAGLVYGI